MPLQLPVLDDRNFEQLVDEAKRRIAVHTPEWTNFESDPGITLVQTFAFLTDTLLYRANRIPVRNRLKFLQLLGIPLQPPAAADGLITIRNERGPVQPLVLSPGVVVSAGSVDFITRDPVNVLPAEAQIYYKRPIPETDRRYQDCQTQYEAIVAARLAAETDATGETLSLTGKEESTGIKLSCYDTLPLPAPTPSDPQPEVNLAETLDQALYIALLAPKNVPVEDVRAAIARQTLSIGVVPALSGEVPPLSPLQPAARRAPIPSLVYEIANVQGETPAANWARLRVLRGPDVLARQDIVQVELPDVNGLQRWEFHEPLLEGTGDFPPRLEDDEVRERLVTWIRLRLPASADPLPADVAGGVPDQASGSGDTRLTWVGINSARIQQAVLVVNELLGRGTGEPDQVAVLANTPVIKNSVRLVIEDANGFGQTWRMTDDLLAAGDRDPVFTLDPESGQIRFGDGLRGLRPPATGRILASYEYGGGPQGNVGIGAINSSRDVRLQGGYKTSNPVPTSGGSLGETADEGERNIPQVLRHRDRLVTTLDFQDVVRRTPGVDVGRVDVVPLYRPKNGDEPIPGVVTVMVMPRIDSRNPLWPTPDRLFLRRVCDHMDPRRLVTTEIYVQGPSYVDVYVSVGIQVQGGFFPDEVRQTVGDRLSGYLSSLPPGGPLGQGWPLKKRIMQKDLEAVVTRVPGVEYVHNLQLGVRSAVDITDEDLTGLELPRLVALNVVEGTAEQVAAIFARPPGGAPPVSEVVPVPVIRATC